MHFENERASPFVRCCFGQFPMNSLLCVERGARASARGCVHRPSCNKRICARECAHVAEQSSADNAISAKRTGDRRAGEREREGRPKPVFTAFNLPIRFMGKRTIFKLHPKNISFPRMNFQDIRPPRVHRLRMLQFIRLSIVSDGIQ